MTALEVVAAAVQSRRPAQLVGHAVFSFWARPSRKRCSHYEGRSSKVELHQLVPYMVCLNPQPEANPGLVFRTSGTTNHSAYLTIVASCERSRR